MKVIAYDEVRKINYIENMTNMSNTILLLIKTIAEQQKAHAQLAIDNMKLRDELNKKKRM